MMCPNSHGGCYNWSTLPELVQPPPIHLLLLSAFLIRFSLMGVFTILPLWIQQQINWGPQKIGYVYVLWGILCVTVQSVVVGPLSHRYGEANLLFWGSILTAFGLFIMPFSTNIALVLGALVIQVIGFNICRPAVLNSLLSQAAGAKRQAKILSFAGAIGALACTVSPVFSGFVFGNLSPSWTFWNKTILMLIVSIISWKVARSSQLSMAVNNQRQRKLKRLFTLLDYDKNGFIERADFEQVVNTIAEIQGLNLGSSEYWLVHSYWIGLGERLQTLMDTDKDGKITAEEWLEYMGRKLDHDFVDTFFQMIDTDSNGQIVIHELKMFYQAYKIGTIQDAKVAFDSLDLNQDGHISLEEMKQIFEQFMYNDEPQIQSPWSVW
ncbi:MAG: MFS transporter [Coleofasciculus chthonoplastes F2-STO-03]